MDGVTADIGKGFPAHPVAIWPPEGTLVLAGPSLEQREGGRHKEAPGPHWSCRTKAFSTREGLDSVFGAAAE